MLFAMRLHGDGQKSIETTRFIRFSWMFPCRQRASRKHRNPNGLLMFLSDIFRQGWEQQPQRQRIIKDFDVSVMPLHGTGANKGNIVFLMVFYTFLRFQGSCVISRSKFRGGVETGLGGSKSYPRNPPDARKTIEIQVIPVAPKSFSNAYTEGNLIKNHREHSQVHSLRTAIETYIYENRNSLCSWSRTESSLIFLSFIHFRFLTQSRWCGSSFILPDPKPTGTILPCWAKLLLK